VLLSNSERLFDISIFAAVNVLHEMMPVDCLMWEALEKDTIAYWTGIMILPVLPDGKLLTSRVRMRAIYVKLL